MMRKVTILAATLVVAASWTLAASAQNQAGSLNTSANLNVSDLENAMASTNKLELDALRSNDASFTRYEVGTTNGSLAAPSGVDKLDLAKSTAMSAQINTLNPPIKP
jgi:hypothetical protein